MEIPAEPIGVPAAHAYWRGWSEIRADLRSSVRLVLVLALAGVVAGLLWWWLAPRADFKVTSGGPVPIGNPSEELLIADDSVLALILFGFGLVAGVAAWFLRARRGVGTLFALAVGGAAMAVVAWQLGEFLGAGPTRAQLTDVGRVVTTPLHLGSLAALALASFAALLAYLVPVVTAHRDDLGRTPASPGAPEPVTDVDPRDDDSLVAVPPSSPGRGD